jgi:hypothetical protein
MTVRRQGLRAISSQLPDVTKGALAKRGFVAARVIADWREIVGPELAESSMPDRLVRSKGADSATLVIRVRPAAALELQHWIPMVMERVNGHFGFRAIDRIRLIQGPVTGRRRPVRPAVKPLAPEAAQEIATRVSTVADEGLREALSGLGRAIRTRAK